MNRRQFLQTTSAAVAAISLGVGLPSQQVDAPVAGVEPDSLPPGVIRLTAKDGSFGYVWIANNGSTQFSRQVPSGRGE